MLPSGLALRRLLYAGLTARGSTLCPGSSWATLGRSYIVIIIPLSDRYPPSLSPLLTVPVRDRLTISPRRGFNSNRWIKLMCELAQWIDIYLSYLSRLIIYVENKTDYSENNRNTFNSIFCTFQYLSVIIKLLNTYTAKFQNNYHLDVPHVGTLCHRYKRLRRSWGDSKRVYPRLTVIIESNLP